MGLLQMRAVLLVMCAAMAGCSGAAPQGQLLDPARVVVAPQPWPTARVAANDAPPVILAVWLSETTIAPGDWWSGRIATSTNVASVEVRTESFSWVAERTAFGQFRFSQHLLDLIPQYKRGYTLQIIARNSAGDRSAVLVPIRFQ